MKTLLVLGKNPALAAALRAVLDPQTYRVLAKGEVWEAEPLLRPGLIDACVLDADQSSVQPLHMVQRLRRAIPGCPTFIFAESQPWAWEEEAYLEGVNQVLAKPLRGRLFNAILDRLWAAVPPPVGVVAAPSAKAPERPDADPAQNMSHTLGVLRDFSAVLSHSLCSEALLKQFLLMLREIMGVNRAAIFLRHPPRTLNPTTDPGEDRQMPSACAIGIAPEFLEHFALSLEAGIGGYVFRRGRILKSQSEDALRDIELQKEFEMLGAQVAIPILDRESLIGVAVFDSPLTGEPFTNEVLALAFHLLEQLGLAIKNSWLYDQLSANHEMMTDILSQLASGCVVVGRNLEILHANKMARSLFSQREGYVLALDFCELPQILGSKVFEVLKTGKAAPSFKFRPNQGGEKVYEIGISPFHRRNANAPSAALVLIEDVTQIERTKTLEIESANLRLMAGMSEHLAHEIGNALVPVSTYQQLFNERWSDPEFRTSLNQAVSDSVHRIGRLAQQMLYLSRDTFEKTEAIPVESLVSEAFAVAQNNLSAKTAKLVFEKKEPFTLAGDKAALKVALAEILLNAIQASPETPEARVRIQRGTNGHSQLVQIEVQDAGPGFTADAIRNAQQPFFSTRNVGVGLGLTVSRKIIEAHHGKLDVGCEETGANGLVCVSLPIKT
jgi:nitrogen-specific signal transduction histidine kinase/GAF domain-containing protein